MNIEKIKQSAGSRELEIINHADCVITKYDPRDRGSIGKRIKESCGQVFFSVKRGTNARVGYVGETYRIYEICAWHESSNTFTL